MVSVNPWARFRVIARVREIASCMVMVGEGLRLGLGLRLLLQSGLGYG